MCPVEIWWDASKIGLEIVADGRLALHLMLVVPGRKRGQARGGSLAGGRFCRLPHLAPAAAPRARSFWAPLPLDGRGTDTSQTVPCACSALCPPQVVTPKLNATKFQVPSNDPQPVPAVQGLKPIYCEALSLALGWPGDRL